MHASLFALQSSVQGFRRCQAAGEELCVGSLAADGREFFTRRPIWRAGGVSLTDYPEGYMRLVNGASGTVYWSRPTEEGIVWETTAFWEKGGIGTNGRFAFGNDLSLYNELCFEGGG